MSQDHVYEYIRVTEGENDEPTETPSEDDGTAGGWEIWCMLSTISKITKEKRMRQMLHQQ
uniref:Uncharacterized protein n=1 Tax=Colobus angolensis palliatus TaxID=336983 RepID=A0A2K5HRY7_COLAP